MFCCFEQWLVKTTKLVLVIPQTNEDKKIELKITQMELKHYKFNLRLVNIPSKKKLNKKELNNLLNWLMNKKKVMQKSVRWNGDMTKKVM